MVNQNQNLNEYYFINHKREFVAKVRNKSFIVMTFKSAAVYCRICGVSKFDESRNKTNRDSLNQGCLSKNL
jgi:hypothetical protein